MAGIVLRFDGLCRLHPADAWKVPPLRAAPGYVSRRASVAMFLCLLSFPPLCQPSAN
jgi:hypothetical protein